MKKSLAVVALGGNSFLLPNEKGTIADYKKNIFLTCECLLELIKRGVSLVITHGNGPQVGNILLQMEAGSKLYQIPSMPLDICNAFTQGFLGYLIEQQLRNILNANKIKCDISVVITQVLVDRNDSAFKNPTKPIGPYYSKEEAERISKESDSVFKEDPRGLGWRKVVPSPIPQKILNEDIIKKLIHQDTIVIALGGGGIPVFFNNNNQLEGIEAVIDKDLSSSLLACQLNADEFYILTDISNVFLNFKKPNEKHIDIMTVSEAIRYLEEGHFSEGSMAPKIKAAINFVNHTKKQSIITIASNLNKPNTGTKIVFEK